MKLLLTAFDPFGGEPVNPALEAVKKVQNQIGSVSIVKLEVPTVFGTSIQTVAKAIEQEMPVYRTGRRTLWTDARTGGDQSG